MKLTHSRDVCYILLTSSIIFFGQVLTFSLRGFTHHVNERSKLKFYHDASVLLGKNRVYDHSNVRQYDLLRANPPHIEDDGYSTRFGKVRGKFRSTIKSAVKRIFRGKPKPGTLILVRHGETVWNFNSTFAGWVDVDLSQQGRREMEHAGRLLLERGYDIDVTYTSRLKRAIRSSWILLQELNQIYRPVYKSYRLNERMYGAFEGMSKPLLAKGLGKEVVQAYRLELDSRPPPMTPTHPYWHKNDRKYADLDPADIPVTESLQDTMDRTLPLWNSRIRPELESGNNVMVVAHGHSLKGLIRHIDELNPEQIQAVGIPNGIPLVYKFDMNMRPVAQNGSELPLSGEFLEKKGLLQSALAHEAELAKRIHGYDLFEANMSGYEKALRYSPPLDPYLTGLVKLENERKLLSLLEAEAATKASGFDAPKSISQQIKAVPSKGGRGGKTPTSYRHFMTVIKSYDPSVQVEEEKSSISSIKGPIIVIIRHGKTEHNKLGLFTGWEDAPLAAEGRAEAQEAGRLLKLHGITFDIVYTSWLSRAIETAWLVLDELDLLWLPIIKTWRLNERMYGALTGMSKLMVGQKHGQKQLKLWRRSYATRPPQVSSFSSDYPGNDDRYVKHVKDIRISVFESLIRSLSHFKIEVHRKFPKTESLRDCMERTIPFYLGTIYPDSIAQGQSVLIASSENAIRGLLMHLCEIPTDRIHEVEIPTGLPLIFDLERKCVKLLDDGKRDSNPLLKYNFGTSPDLLFRPCDLSDDDLQSAGTGADGEGKEEKDSCYLDESGKLYAYDPIIRLPTPSPSSVSEEDDENNLDDPLHSGDRVEGFERSSVDSALL